MKSGDMYFSPVKEGSSQLTQSLQLNSGQSSTNIYEGNRDKGLEKPSVGSTKMLSVFKTSRLPSKPCFSLVRPENQVILVHFLAGSKEIFEKLRRGEGLCSPSFNFPFHPNGSILHRLHFPVFFFPPPPLFDLCLVHLPIMRRKPLPIYACLIPLYAMVSKFLVC